MAQRALLFKGMQTVASRLEFELNGQIAGLKVTMQINSGLRSILALPWKLRPGDEDFLAQVHDLRNGLGRDGGMRRSHVIVAERARSPDHAPASQRQRSRH